MKLVIGIVRPERTNDVLEALYRADIRGFSVIRIQGHGDGLFYGDAGQLGAQALAVLAAPAYAFAMTWLLLKGLGLVMDLRGSDDDEALGMDLVHHGEEAYASGEGAILIGVGGGPQRRGGR